MINLNWHDPATWFMLAYGVARVVSHVTPSYTWLGKACGWVLGHVTPTPTGGNVSSSSNPS